MNLLRFPGVALLVVLGCLHVSGAPIVTPYARQGGLEIRNVSMPTNVVEQFDRVELRFDLSGTFDNPFDPDDIAIDARLHCPSGKVLLVPGFFARDFTRELRGRSEQLSPTGEVGWRVRVTPVEVGVHSITIVARDRSGTIESVPVRLAVRESNNSGFVRISKKDKRYFAFDNGKSYYPIGANVCWAYGRGTFDYDDWFSGYATNGGNYARLWLSPNWTTFALERSGKREDGLGMGQFDLANAWRIDYVLDLARRHGMRVMVCIDSYNILRQKDGYPQWDQTPHNVANGGPLTHPTQFWTNSAMDKLYRDKLRYLVARYGADPAVLSWEFWNEVDITTGYKTAPVKAWHERMITTLRKLDPYRHLITTSFAGTGGIREIDTLRGIDYVQTHHYNSPDLAVTVADAYAQKSAYGKPHIVGEIGADSGGPRIKDDPNGLQVHDPAWVSIALADAGSAQAWWWDNLIHPRGLYPLFGAMARFTADIDWPGEGFRSVKPRTEWQQPPNPPLRKDLTFSGGPMSWNPSEFNRPRRVQITRVGAAGELPISGVQHGTKNHPREHNPITFEVNLPWPTRFEVLVTDVSGHGGAALNVRLDGKGVLTNSFDDSDGDRGSSTLKQYSGTYGVDLPTGKHEIVVENTGADWFMASYRLRDAVESTAPPIMAWASVGANTAMMWARVEDRTWQRICGRKESVDPCPPTIVTLPGLTSGHWQVEHWDTWKGVVIATSDLKVPASGDARFLVPQMETDIALKLRRRR